MSAGDRAGLQGEDLDPLTIQISMWSGNAQASKKLVASYCDLFPLITPGPRPLTLVLPAIPAMSLKAKTELPAQAFLPVCFPQASKRVQGHLVLSYFCI